MKILVVEDDEFDFSMVKRSLIRAFPDQDLNFHWIDKPIVGEICENIDTFDVCFIDYRLGCTSGIDLIKQLCEVGAKVPFILLTGDANSNLDHLAIAAGAADFLHKDNLSVSSIHRSTRFCLARTEQEKRLTEMAYKDALTGLSNRAAFDQRCRLSLSKRTDTDKAIAMFLIDLDKFKDVNDTYGHPVGDFLLKDFSKELASHFSTGDMVARLGGDEFGALLHLPDGTQSSGSLKKWLRSALKTEFKISDLTLNVSCSIGVNVVKPGSSVVETTDVLSQADRSLYSDKRLRRLKNLDFHPVKGAFELDLEPVVQGLSHAISRNEFEVVYQPKVNCTTGAVSGLEALLRWNSPDFAIGPAQFIPIAEEFGLIKDIGKWVLRACCKQLNDWASGGQTLHPIAINVSVLQLEDPNFAGMVELTLEEYQIDPSLLEFELTEGAFGSHLESCLDQMQSLADLGCSWAIDDFGVGYSSLSRLHKLPISRLKIDKSFLDQLPDDVAARNISNAIISLARSLSLTVVAEGVESPGQLVGLELSGHDEIQGFHYHHPMHALDITGILTPPHCTALHA